MSSNTESETTKTASTNKHVARNMFYVSLFLVVGKFAGAAKEMAIAYRFGVSEVVDLYVFSLSIVMWLPTIWASVSTSTLVPLTDTANSSKTALFHSELVGWLAVISLIFSALALLAAPSFEHRLASQFGVTEGVMFCLVCLVAAAFFSILIMHFNALLLISERHLNTLLNGVPALCLLTFVLVNPFDADLKVLAAGMLVGVLIHFSILLYLLRNSSLISWPRLTFRSDTWKQFKSAFGIMFVSTVIISVTPIIDQIFAATLETGSVSRLGFSSRLLALFLGIGATGIARSILPVLSKQTEQSAQLDLATRWYFILFTAGCLLMAAAWVAAPEMVKFLYQRGAFTATDTDAVADIFRMALTQVPFYFAGIVLVQYFTSRKYYWTLLFSSCVAVIAKMALAPLLARELGVEGIALSTGLMYAATFSYLTILFFLDRSKFR